MLVELLTCHFAILTRGMHQFVLMWMRSNLSGAVCVYVKRHEGETGHVSHDILSTSLPHHTPYMFHHILSTCHNIFSSCVPHDTPHVFHHVLSTSISSHVSQDILSLSLHTLSLSSHTLSLSSHTLSLSSHTSCLSRYLMQWLWSVGSIKS